MLKLDSKLSKPDFMRRTELIQDSINKGIQIYIPTEIRGRAEQDKSYLEHYFNENYGVTKPNSPQQVCGMLEKLSYKYPQVRECCFNVKTGKWSSQADNLEKLAGLNIDFVEKLKLYRDTTAYTKAFNSLEAACDSQGRIHPQLSTLITNRVSYSNPGLMSIPKKILWTVVQPRTPGWYLWRIDIKNQEPWIMINHLGIRKLQDILKTVGDKGLYRYVYYDVYGQYPNDAQYKETKIAWNALAYGSSKKSLIESIFAMGETEDRPSDNGRAFYDWFNSFDEIKRYQKDIRSKAYSGVRQTQTVFGTKIKLENCTPGQASRRLMDYWIQGTGADILTFLVTNFEDYRHKYQMEDQLHLYYTRHDEVILEMSPDFFNHFGEQGCISRLSYIFAHTIDDWFPCGLEIEMVSRSLQESTSLKDED